MNKRLQVKVPLIIPAYEPDERMTDLIDALEGKYNDVVVIVNDGSDSEFDKYYEKACMHQFIVLKHYKNMGKGRALKNAFNYCLTEFPEMIGCVTADSDGQHSVEDILKCRENLIAHPDDLTLGCRKFDDKNIPIKSLLGNKITRFICKALTGLTISDTQTGLRGIPKKFMEELLNVFGERFEFETQMLICSKNQYPIREISIQTIYDSKEQHHTHFDPIKDSIRIYKIFGQMFIKFMFSSLSASVIDLLLFFCLVNAFKEKLEWYIAFSTIVARIVSAIYNYCINYKVVFQSDEKHLMTTIKYFGLAVCQMMCSSVLVTLGYSLIPFIPEIIVKIIVDICLFFASYQIQREKIF